MPTKFTSSAQLVLCIYDVEKEENDPFSFVVSTDHQMSWGKGRFLDLEDRSLVGLKVNPYYSTIENQDSLVSGIREDLNDGKWWGTKRLGGDKESVPLFHEGRFQYKNNWHDFAADRTIHTPFNFLSDIDVSSSNRHKFSFPFDIESPISLTVYKREIEKVDKPYIEFQQVDEFSVYPSHLSNIYHKGPFIDYSVIDTSTKEFMIDYMETKGNEIICNDNIDSLLKIGHTYPYVDSTELIPVLSKLLPTATPLTYLTEYYSVKDFHLYSKIGATLPEWTSTTPASFITPSYLPTDKVYVIDKTYGKVYLNPNMIEIPGELYCHYKAIPMLQYSLPTEQGHHYTASEASLKRIVTNLDKGSLIFCLRDIEQINNAILSLDSETLISSDGYLFSGAYYGDSIHKVILSVNDESTDEPLASIPVKLESLTPYIKAGSFLGTEETDVLYTDENGQIILYFQPAPLGDSIGITNLSRDGVNFKKLNTTGSNLIHGFEDMPNELYLYLIYKDDPLIGRAANPGWDPGSTPSNFEGTILWDSTKLNGRKRILYELSNAHRNPIDNTLGAFVPTRVGKINNNSFEFLSDLPLAEPSNDSNVIGGYFMAGPRKVRFRASIDTSLIDTPNPSTFEFEIVVRLSPYAKGEYIDLSNNKYPLGWRLPSGSLQASSQIGGALFLTLDPVSGTYDVLYPIDTNTTVKTISSELGILFEVV